MTQEKKSELFGSLYTLRAGLSVVSQLRDETTGIIAAVERKNKSSIGKAQSDLAESEKRVKSCEYDLRKAQESRGDYDDVGFDGCKFGGTILVIVALGIFVFFLAEVILAWMGRSNIFDGEIGRLSTDVDLLENLALGGIMLLLALIPLIIVIVVIAKTSLSVGFALSSFMIAKVRQSAKQRSAKFNNAVSVAESDLSHAQNSVDMCKRQVKSEKANARRRLTEAIEQAEKPARVGAELINTLNKTFDDILDMRDWANLDLIIFSLETGRADNMKEALAVVDRECQMNRIADAVAQASMEICNTIKIGLSNVVSSVNRGFARLNDNLRNMTDRMIESNNSQAAYLSKIVSQTSMNNALMSKADVSSAALAADVAQLRNLADIQAVKQRNNL